MAAKPLSANKASRGEPKIRDNEKKDRDVARELERKEEKRR